MVNKRAEFSLVAEEAVEDFIRNNPNHRVSDVVSELPLAYGKASRYTYLRLKEGDK
jgi:hypothetical protein